MGDIMLKIVFKNLEPSQLARDIVKQRIEPIIEKFPALTGHKVTLTLEMENSPDQAGPDLFTVSSMVTGKNFNNLKIKKSSRNFFLATAELVDGFNELLSRENDRLFKRNRNSKLINAEVYE
jgi:ribosome-associated translation inhibitor RaiA